MNQDLFNQIPVLEQLYRYLEQLSMMDVPVESFEKSKLLVHQVPDMTLELLKDDDWSDIASQQKRVYISEPVSSKEAFTTRYVDSVIISLASIYNLSELEQFLEDPKCGQCGSLAVQRCSRCRLEWYCSRPCQVKAWDAHKKVCDMMAKG